MSSCLLVCLKHNREQGRSLVWMEPDTIKTVEDFFHYKSFKKEKTYFRNEDDISAFRAVLPHINFLKYAIADSFNVS